VQINVQTSGQRALQIILYLICCAGKEKEVEGVGLENLEKISQKHRKT
jgi:hypothetical protein